MVANLPYNIGTPLLVRWLDAARADLERLTLMFQREVAARIAAPPGSRAYGRLSVLVQWLCEARTPDASAGPGVRAAAQGGLQPDPADAAAAAPGAGRQAMPRAGAGGRLPAAAQDAARQPQKPRPTAPEALLEAAGVPATARAEQIDVAGFCRLARCYQALRRAR